MTGKTTSRARREVGEEPDLIRYYLDEIAGTPLLSAAEEVALAKRIEAGVYAAELLRAADAGEQTLTVERGDLVAVAEDGARAKEHMIRANLRLVVAGARRYARRGLPLLDAIQEGNLGLIRAVEKFDYTKGFKFSTYAMWWIRQAIGRGIAESGRTIRLPVHISEQLARLGRLERELERELLHQPSAEELAEAADLPVARVLELRRAGRETVSLDTPVGDDGDLRLVDLIDTGAGPRAVDAAEHAALAAELRSVLATLPDRQARILALRYGLRDGRARTLHEVAAQVGLTYERVRQLEKQALHQLREARHRERLLDWAG